MEIKTYEGIVSDIKDETYDVKTITVESENLSYKPGSFMMLSLPNLKDSSGKFITRAFSFSSSPTEKPMFTLKYYEKGAFTSHIFKKIKTGDKIIMKGPHGQFKFDEREDFDSVVMLAAGSGIAPIRGIIKYIVDKKINIPVTLIYTSREQKDIIYKEELHKFAEEENIEIKLSLTNPHDDWEGLKGRISKQVIEKNIKFTEKAIFYICGPPEMVFDIKKWLRNLGVEKSRIRTEAW